MPLWAHPHPSLFESLTMCCRAKHSRGSNSGRYTQDVDGVSSGHINITHSHPPMQATPLLLCFNSALCQQSTEVVAPAAAGYFLCVSQYCRVQLLCRCVYSCRCRSQQGVMAHQWWCGSGAQVPSAVCLCAWAGMQMVVYVSVP